MERETIEIELHFKDCVLIRRLVNGVVLAPWIPLPLKEARSINIFESFNEKQYNKFFNPPPAE